MNFDFDDTQYALRDLARDLFARESPPSRVRGLWEGKPFDRGVWKTMAEAGITGITVPEEFGGAGGTEIDLALVFEEAGRAALPEPIVETIGIAAPLVARFGSDEMRERWLPAIVRGEAVAAVQAHDDDAVAWASETDVIVVIHSDHVHVVGGDRVRVEPISSIDRARPLAHLPAADLRDTNRLNGGEDAMRYAVSQGVFGTACVQNGIAIRLLEMTLDYVKDREQFGRPVGSFQAIKHKLADMHTAIASSRPAAWYAGHAMATEAPDASEACAVAKVAASETEEMCNAEALQCHGGIGFTWEHDLHLWLKRGIALRSAFGDAALHRRGLAKTLLST